MKTRLRQAGFTLPELLITIAILSILMAMAVPSLQDVIDRKRVQGATEGLYADMQFAKSEAVKRGISMRIVTTSGSPWSYCVTSSNCTTAADVLKTVAGADFPFTSLNVSTTVTFNFQRGTATSRTLTFTGNNPSNTGQIVVSSLGRIKLQ